MAGGMEGKGVRDGGCCPRGTMQPKEWLMLLATDSSLLTSVSCSTLRKRIVTPEAHIRDKQGSAGTHCAWPRPVCPP